MRVESYSIINKMSGTDMSQIITSNPFTFEHLYSLGIDAQYTGTPSGTLAVEYSIDGSLWNVRISQAVAGAGSWYFDLTAVSAKFVRLKWTPGGVTSGTITIANLIAKGV